MSTIDLSLPGAFLRQASQAPRPWWRGPAGLLALAVHAALFGALWQLAAASQPLMPEARAIELVLAPVQSLVAHEAPPPKPAPAPKAVARPVSVPVSIPAPVRTMPVAAAQAEVQASAPAPSPVVPSVAPAAADPVPARAVTAVPKTLSAEGISSDYVNQVFERINRRVVYPRAARLRGEQGRVAYRLTLSPQGDLLKLDIQSSGSDELDQAAAKAIKAAAPFSKLPDLGGSTYLLAGSIQFSLNAL